MIFANIDGYNAITMAIFAALVIIDGAIAIDDVVQYIVKVTTTTPPIF